MRLPIKSGESLTAANNDSGGTKEASFAGIAIIGLKNFNLWGKKGYSDDRL